MQAKLQFTEVYMLLPVKRNKMPQMQHERFHFMIEVSTFFQGCMRIECLCSVHFRYLRVS